MRRASHQISCGPRSKGVCHAALESSDFVMLRQNGAVRSPRTESAIITDRAQNGGFGLPRLPYSRLPKGIGRGNPGAGNGIFGCRDGRLRIGLRDRKYHQRPKERNDTGEYPRRNGLFGADPEICGLEGLYIEGVTPDGLKNLHGKDLEACRKVTLAL